MKITDVNVFQISGRWTGPTWPPGDRQARPLDIYPEFNQQEVPETSAESVAKTAIYVEIETDEGISGLYGPIDETQAFIVRKSLQPFLLGRDPLATEALQDQMVRLHRHGRSGLFMTGISAIDCALWDLKGKAWGEPVYRLLGGPTRPVVPAYASMLGFSVNPEKAVEIALDTQDRGFMAQKWFFRHGPGDGPKGMEKNLALARSLREALGPHYHLMFDAFMGWDVSYAVKMVQGLAAVNPTWVEEPIPPERVGGLCAIREAARVPIATGEHVYGRWQVKELLVEEAVDFLQTDPDWTGGITELAKICALGSAFEIPVVAHGHSLLPALHVAAAQSPATVPWVEFLIQYQETKQFFHKPIYRPEEGVVALPELPGLGLVLDEEKVESRQLLGY
jgi:L-rhamnonate dehydratase